TNPQVQLTLLIHSYNKSDSTVDVVNGVPIEHTYYVKSNSNADLKIIASPRGATYPKTASFSSKTNVYELVGTSKNGLDGGGVMQFMFTEPGGTYTVTTGTGSQAALTCPSTNPSGCASVIAYKSTGGVWFSSAWGPVG